MWLLRSALPGRFGAPWPRLTAVEPARTEETVAPGSATTGPTAAVLWLVAARLPRGGSPAFPVRRLTRTSRGPYAQHLPSRLLDQEWNREHGKSTHGARRLRMTASNDGRHTWEAAPERCLSFASEQGRVSAMADCAHVSVAVDVGSRADAFRPGTGQSAAVVSRRRRVVHAGLRRDRRRPVGVVGSRPRLRPPPSRAAARRDRSSFVAAARRPDGHTRRPA